MEAVEEGEVSEHKKGDRVLVEAEYVDRTGPHRHDVEFLDADCDKLIRPFGCNEIHAHPGVPVADLVEELELLHKIWNAGMYTHNQHLPGWKTAKDWNARVHQLRDAREAAAEPKLDLEAEQQIWVRANVADGAEYTDGTFQVFAGNLQGNPREVAVLRVHPDDIRTEEP